MKRLEPIVDMIGDYPIRHGERGDLDYENQYACLCGEPDYMHMNTDQPTTVNTACTHPQVTHYHGTFGSYQSDACRCDDCRAANAAYYRRQRGQQTVARQPETSPDWTVGSAEWLAVMRRGLYQAVAESFERHGRVA